MPPPKGKHGIYCMRIGSLLHQFVEQHKLGFVSSNDSGVILDAELGTVVGPDVAFYSLARQPNLPEGYFEIPPDLAIEILSPDDKRARVRDKIRLYIDAGVRLVWLVDGEARTVTVYTGNLHGVEYDEADQLTGGDVLPGFTMAIQQIFAG